MTERTPQLPDMSGRLVFWEQAIPDFGRSWAKLFLNRLQLADQERGHPARKELAVFVTSLGELRAAVDNHPASFVFAEVTTTHYRKLLGQIPQLRRTMPMLHIVVVCLELPERPVDEYNVFDSLFREAGATAVLATLRELLAMIPAVLTHFADLPQRKIGWRESIEQQLPWRKFSHSRSFRREDDK